MSWESRGCIHCDLCSGAWRPRHCLVLLMGCHWWTPTIPKTIFVSSIGIYFTNISILSVGFSSLMLSSAGVAPLPPSLHRLLSVTVTTLAVLPSWMYRLGGDDNCILSVPSSTCNLRIGCWKCGGIFQEIAAEAFTLINYALWFSPKCGWWPSVRSCCLATVTWSTIPVFSAWQCVFPLLSVVTTGFPGHAGGWHLRKKPCVVLRFFFLHSVLLVVALARWAQAACG